jgi:hypothetical protein
VVIATYAKAGTTWTQQIVAQLIFGGRGDVEVATLSPWLDLRIPPKEVKLAALEAQPHRRFIKTHLPVDALVFSPDAKYVYVGRDGRDVVWSLHNHHANATEDWYRLFNDTPGRVGPPLAPPPASVRQYFLEWLEGKPLPGAIDTTVKNLREIAPTWYFNVPRGFEALLPYLREDEALRKRFFSRVKVLWFAAAALPQHVYDAYNALAYDTCGETIPSESGSPARTKSFSCTKICLDSDTRYVFSTVPSLLVTTISCAPRFRAPKLTTPSISLTTAGFEGLRASNNSVTRGRPPVISRDLPIVRGILAST